LEVMTEMTSTAAPPLRDIEEWVAGFAAGWAEPTDADGFADHFERMMADDIRLVQPQLPTTIGKRAFREQFARPLFALLSEVRGTVESWATAGDVAFIELRIRGRLGSREVELRTIDKVTVRDGLAVERVAYTDPLPMLGAVALSPRAWPTFARIQLERLVKR
jgi:ketosteroid isomerase-like protein